VGLRVLAPGERMRRRNMLPSCRLANGCIGREHVIELQPGGWVHGRNILSSCSLANGCMGGIFYLVAAWRMGVWEEHVMELVAVEWVHGGICYRVAAWRMGAWEEHVIELKTGE